MISRFIASLLLFFAAPLMAQSMIMPNGPGASVDISGKANLTGGNTWTGAQNWSGGNYAFDLAGGFNWKYGDVTNGYILGVSATGPEINIRPETGLPGILSWTHNGVADRWSNGVKTADANLYWSAGDRTLSAIKLTLGNTGNLTATGVVAGAGVTSTAAITSSSGTAGVGYATGAGGAVTQITSRTTGVTLNKVCGAITLFATTTTAGQVTTMTVTDSAIAATDVIIVDQKTGTNIYIPAVTAIAAGSFNLSVYTPAAATSEGPVMQFCTFKGANS